VSESFEENLAKLEEIVNELEKGEVPLDTAIEKYSEAMNLVKMCEDKIEEVSQKVKKVNESGQLEDFKPEEDG